MVGVRFYEDLDVREACEKLEDIGQIRAFRLLYDSTVFTDDGSVPGGLESGVDPSVLATLIEAGVLRRIGGVLYVSCLCDEPEQSVSEPDAGRPGLIARIESCADDLEAALVAAGEAKGRCIEALRSLGPPDARADVERRLHRLYWREHAPAKAVIDAHRRVFGRRMKPRVRRRCDSCGVEYVVEASRGGGARRVHCDDCGRRIEKEDRRRTESAAREREERRRIEAEAEAARLAEAIAPGAPSSVADLRALPYSEYLRTDHWTVTADGARRRARWRCQRCGSSRDLNVHHLTYDRLGEELDTDLLVLCRDCHELWHGAREGLEAA